MEVKINNVSQDVLNCPVCNLYTGIDIILFPDWLEGGKFHEYNNCSRCGSSWRKIQDEESVYETSEQNIARDKNSLYVRFFSAIIRFFLGRIVITINSSLESGGLVLDIGCGRGKLMQEFRKRGQEVYGIEPNEIKFNEARREFADNVVQGVYDPAHFRSKEFDTVVFWHVLEHLNSINESILSVKEHAS
ncbi:methyltransferase domain-containing protein, partial [candidate division KSB1 bacterium]|nr:methyltransferase domain-containing protein [candidate division KSB1 bacterium]